MLNSFFSIISLLLLNLNPPVNICTLNMQNYGEKPDKIPIKKESFSSAIQKANCKIVALQEISNVKEQNINLEKLVGLLDYKYKFYIQESNSKQLLGFLYDKIYQPDFKTLKLELPKLHYLEQQSEQKRKPLLMNFFTQNKQIQIINLHSKSRGGIDLRGQKNELERLRESIALRDELQHGNYLITGDLNADPDSVSIQAFFLNLELKNFKFREDGVILDYPVRLYDLYYLPSLLYKNKYGYSDYFIIKGNIRVKTKPLSLQVESDHKMLFLSVN